MISIDLTGQTATSPAPAAASASPRRVPWQAATGPVLTGAGLGLFTLIGTSGNYLTELLPSVAIFGPGLAVTVAPLTATVLAAVPERHADMASAVNNDVARAAALLAVTLLPAAGGITGSAYWHPSRCRQDSTPHLSSPPHCASPVAHWIRPASQTGSACPRSRRTSSRPCRKDPPHETVPFRSAAPSQCTAHFAAFVIGRTPPSQDRPRYGSRHALTRDYVQVTSGGKMSTPTGDNAFLHELELNVRTELTLAETSQPERGGDDEPTGERRPNPAAQHYEIRLRTLLDAVEAMEVETGSGDLPPQPEMLRNGIAVEHRPYEPSPGLHAEGR